VEPGFWESVFLKIFAFYIEEAFLKGEREEGREGENGER
jgi:hypothetical protein